MHCEYCGNAVDSEDTRCPSCGGQVDHQEGKTINVTIDLNGITNVLNQTSEELRGLTEALGSDDGVDAQTLRYTPSVKSYMVPSIICTVLFLSPFGLAAFINSILVKVRAKSGDIDGAIKASRWAKILMWVGVVAGILMYSFGSRLSS